MGCSAPRMSGSTARSSPPSPAPWQPWARCRSARSSSAARRHFRSTTWPLTMLRFQPVASASRPQPPPPLFPPPIAGEGRGGGILAAAFEAMDHRRIRYAFRKGSEHVNPDTPGSEVDILIDRLELRAAERALREQGFHRLDAPGSPRHRFYLAFDRGRWLKIDAKLARGSGATTRSGSHWEAGEHVLTALAQRRPLGPRRAGPGVALLGPDGAGKGTVIEALKARIR